MTNNLIPFKNRLNRLFDDPFFEEGSSFFDSFFPIMGNRQAVSPLRIDVKETDSSYTVITDLPGINKEDVNISLNDNRLTITVSQKSENEEKEGERILRQERSFSQQQRSIILQQAVKKEDVEATLENGVLTITLQKDPEGDGGKKILIK